MTSIYQLLDQTEFWEPRQGPPVLVDDMRPSHVRNLIAWLERRAPRLKLNYDFRFLISGAGPLGPSGDMACNAFDAAADELCKMDPQVWLSEQPLMIRLRELDRDYRAAEIRQQSGPAHLPAGTTAHLERKVRL